MRLSGNEIEAAITATAAEQRPGELLDFERVAQRLNQQLHDQLVGRPRDARLRPATPAPARFAPAGRCRVCGCTERRACLVATGSAGEFDDRRACGWADASHTLCDNPHCIANAKPARVA
jgi:hypothetical protein